MTELGVFLLVPMLAVAGTAAATWGARLLQALLPRLTSSARSRGGTRRGDA